MGEYRESTGVERSCDVFEDSKIGGNYCPFQAEYIILTDVTIFGEKKVKFVCEGHVKQYNPLHTYKIA